MDKQTGFNSVAEMSLDINKALQIMVNSLDVARLSGKFSFEENYFIAQSIYGIQSLNTGQQPPNENTNEKVMRITWPDNFTMGDYIQVIVRHLELAQKRGAYSFTDSTIIARCIDVIKEEGAEAITELSAKMAEKTTLETIKEETETHQTVVL